ncbi:MAG: diacylglycerol kinase family lipid kinase [bacterium]|nr:diacylglycerol kinase family lipid kinase [bacterium]
MSKTLIILNPHAGSGRAGKLWTQIEPMLWDKLGELVVAVTQNPGEVAQHLDKAYASGLYRVIAIGGDGTNHALVNALADLNAQHPDGPPMIYGTLPVGTGRDWARSRGIPFDLEKAAEWIAHAQPQPTDIGLLTLEGGNAAPRREHFLNIASAGLGGDVVKRVNRRTQRRPWTFLRSTVESILSYRPEKMKITVDGETWFDDRALVVAVANGTTFGHGMKIAPQATTDDGLFDVVVVENAPKLRVLAALRRVYEGTHLTHPNVAFRRGKEIVVTSAQGALGLELDGEQAQGERLTFTVRPGLLHVLS